MSDASGGEGKGGGLHAGSFSRQGGIRGWRGRKENYLREMAGETIEIWVYDAGQ